MKRCLLPKIFIAMLGGAFLLWGAGNMALGIVGEPASAVITHIRREGGERADFKPGRYTYSIGYTFTLPDGTQIDGAAKQIGDGIYRKADGTATLRIRYFRGFPHFSAPEKDGGLRAGPLILIAVGCVLIIWAVRSSHS